MFGYASRNPGRRGFVLYEVMRKRERQTRDRIEKDTKAKIISKCSHCAGRERRHCIQLRWTVHISPCTMKERSQARFRATLQYFPPDEFSLPPSLPIFSSFSAGKGAAIYQINLEHAGTPTCLWVCEKVHTSVPHLSSPIYSNLFFKEQFP